MLLKMLSQKLQYYVMLGPPEDGLTQYVLFSRAVWLVLPYILYMVRFSVLSGFKIMLEYIKTLNFSPFF